MESLEQQSSSELEQAEGDIQLLREELREWREEAESLREELSLLDRENRLLKQELLEAEFKNVQLEQEQGKAVDLVILAIELWEKDKDMKMPAEVKERLESMKALREYSLAREKEELIQEVKPESIE